MGHFCHPDPDSESGSGSTGLIEYGSNPDPDPKPWFLGLLDPGPDPLVRGMDPDPSIIKQKQ